MLDRSLPAAARYRAPLTRRAWWQRVIVHAPAPQAETLIRVRRSAMAGQFEITLPGHLARGLDAARRARGEVDIVEVFTQARLTV